MVQPIFLLVTGAMEEDIVATIAKNLILKTMKKCVEAVVVNFDFKLFIRHFKRNV
jgi:hypothetical protein